MKCLSCSVLLLLFAAANATFWFNDNDYERAMEPYKNSLSHEYLRALSIFKRKLQLLGFYPIVLDDNGLEYISMDPYLIEEDDDDDEMYKLFKKIKKEKKARKKSQKKKLKKSKKKGTTEPTPVETTTVQPISNIVYYWPSSITTIVHPSQGGEDASTFQHSFDTRLSIDDSSDENSSEVDSSSGDQIQKPAKINYQTIFTFGRKLDDGNVETKADKNESATTTTTTTPYPLLTVFPDPEQVAIQEILDQQEIVHKIADDDRGNVTKSVSAEGPSVEGTTETSVTVQDNVTTDETLHTTEERQVYKEIPSHSQDTKDVDNSPADILPSEPTIVTTDVPSVTSLDVTTELSDYSMKPTPSIPAGVLQFFHETLPDEHNSSTSLPNLSEIFDSSPVSNFIDTNLSHKVEETAENDTNLDGYRETDRQHNYFIVQLNEEPTTTQQPFIEHSRTPNSTDDGTNYTKLEITVPTSNLDTNSEKEGHEYLIDPKITHPIKVPDVLGVFESRSLIDEHVVVATVTDKNGRRSDIPIEAEDINEEDTTDNLAYNITSDKPDEIKVVENTSTEVGTLPPPPPPVDTSNNDDQFDGEIIPLIPIIINQMKQGNVSPEEMEILKNSFGPFWPFIVEEASRESDSSEEMNPLLSELLNSVNRKIVKREATFGRRQPVYTRRIYFDDDDDNVEYVRRRGYYGRRRRPYIRIYQKK